MPFIAKVKAIQYADSVVVKINSLSDSPADQEDRLEVFLDPEGKYRVYTAAGGASDVEV